MGKKNPCQGLQAEGVACLIMSMLSLVNQAFLKGLSSHRAAMQLTVNPEKVQVSGYKTLTLVFLSYGTALNSFSVVDNGRFHIRDAILVLGVM
jgi:hypothetical protein